MRKVIRLLLLSFKATGHNTFPGHLFIIKIFAFKHEKEKSDLLLFIKTEYLTDKNRNGKFYFR